MDGRIREILANGTSNQNNQFYDSSANPNTTQALSFNASAHLKIRVFMNGSYIMYWANGDVEDYMWSNNWAKFYFLQKGELARQIRQTEFFDDGSRQIQFFNGTVRYIFVPPSAKNTSY